MKIYLAHNFAARDWLPDVVIRLAYIGHQCTSTWIFDDSHAKGGSSRESALVDLDDINRSDCLVLFTNNYGDRPGKGKYVELGYAMAKGLRIILVGNDNSCVFYSMKCMERVEDVDALVKLLGGF